MRLQTMTTITVNLAAERFCAEEEKGTKKPYCKNLRATKIHDIQKELKSIEEKAQGGKEGGKAPLAELQTMLSEKLPTLHRAKQHWRQRREKLGNILQLINSPFEFISFGREAVDT